MTKRLLTMTLAIASFITSATASAANEKQDLIRCEVSAFKDLGGGSTHTRPVSVVVADGLAPQAAMGFKYDNTDYLVAVGLDGLVATKGLPSTTVSLVKGNYVLTTVDVATLQKKATDGSLFYDSVQSDKVPMPTGESLLIRCSGASARSMLIKSLNTVEALSEKVFGSTAN